MITDLTCHEHVFVQIIFLTCKKQTHATFSFMSRHLRKYLPMIQNKNKASNNDDAQYYIIKCGQQVNKLVLAENNELDNKMEINNINKKLFFFLSLMPISCWGHSIYVPTAMLDPFHLCSNCDVRAIPFIFNCNAGDIPLCSNRNVGAIPFMFQLRCWGHSIYIPSVMLGPFHLYSNCDVGAIPFIFQLRCWGHSIYIPTAMLGLFYLYSNCDVGAILLIL